MSRAVVCAMLLALLAPSSMAAAQPARDDGAERERAFIEGLRNEDPASADRFVALRDAQRQAMAELRRKEGQVNAMPPDLRASFLPQLKQAQRKYLDSQVKILDFLDERDRRGIARLQDEIGQIKRALDERQRSREELKKLLPD